MNNICIYAEVIALARFFLRLLLSPQILNIQHPSPATAPGAQGSDPISGLGLPPKESPHSGMGAGQGC